MTQRQNLSMTQNNGASWLFETDTVEDWAYKHAVFSPEECEKIIKLGESLIPETAVTFTETANSIRDSKISWILPNVETHWIFDKLAYNIAALNNQFFKFDLYGMTEALQFTKYEAPSGHYGEHIDRILHGVPRKLSVTIQLSDPNDYEGGDLKLKHSAIASYGPKEQGCLTIFPSYMLHEVAPVTKGTRYSLVVWVSGPPFK